MEGARLVEEPVLKTVGRNSLGGSIPSPSATQTLSATDGNRKLDHRLAHPVSYNCGGFRNSLNVMQTFFGGFDSLGLHHHVPVAQLRERPICIRGVRGWSPFWYTIFK